MRLVAAVVALALVAASAVAALPVKSDPCEGVVCGGAAKVDLQIPVGVPLAGYNHGQRRVPHWPLPKSEAQGGWGHK